MYKHSEYQQIHAHDDLISKTRRGRNQHSLAFQIPSATKGFYEGDPRSNANPSVTSFTFGISKNGLHVYNDILSIL